MIISNVNIGSGPGANNGESIYSAFYKVNQNFANVQSNVNSLTNSVSSVAGRTGNVTLTINDIVGLNSSYALNGNVTAANIGMKGYVDAKIAANVAALVDSAPAVLDTLNELAAALNDDASFSTTIINTITLANTIQSNQITSANIGVIGYVDNKVSTANIAMKGYVDSVASQSIYGNSNVASYLPTYSGNLTANHIDANFLSISDGPTGLDALHVGIPGLSSFGNSIASFHANINNASYINVHNKNSGDKNLSGFSATAYSPINPENYNVTLQIAGENFNVPALPMYKPYDASLEVIGGNLLISAHDTDFSANKDIIFTTGLIPMYEKLRISNSSVTVTNDVLPSSNISYRLGSLTNQWQNLFSGNATIEVLRTNSITFQDSSTQTTAYTGYGNSHVGAFTNLSTYAYNANVTAANLGMKGYVDSVASQSIYGNSNVKSYLTQFDGNIVPSANVTYSLGNVTHRWKDLYLSGNTIFLGATSITTSGGAVLIPVTRQLFSQSFLPGSTNSAATFTLDRLPTAGSTRIVEVIGVQVGPSPAPSYTLTEGVDFSISGLSLIITTSYTATNISCTESYSDTGDLITATEVATDTIIPTSGDLTVSGNVTVDGDLYVSPTSIYMGNLRISAADGNLKVNTAIKFSDDSVQSTAYSNVQVAAYLTDNPPASSYSNVQVATYLPTYSGNIGNISFSNAGNIFVGNSQVNFVANSSGDGQGYSTIELVPDVDRYNSDQYLIVDPTAPGHIHIRAGGTQDNSSADLFLGGENSYVKLPAGLNPNVQIAANTHVWNFNSTGLYGVLTLPGEGIIQSLDDTINLTSLNTTSGFANTVYLGSGGGLGFFDGALGGNWIEIFRSGAIPEIKAPTGNLLITTVTPGVSSNTWTFGTNGSITFPDTTVQTTAWTGSTYGNVQVATYLPTYTGNISAGNVFVPGTSGKIGFSSGGFVQQATSNATQVTSNTTSGNIQLMGVNLGTNGVLTVAFANNKLTTNDIIVIQHISGGLLSFYVDAYVVSDGLAIIWIRNITGSDTATYYPMLKYAIIRAPSS